MGVFLKWGYPKKWLAYHYKRLMKDYSGGPTYLVLLSTNWCYDTVVGNDQLAITGVYFLIVAGNSE